MLSSYRLNPQQFASVSALPGPARFQHFVARVADWQQVWGLKADGGWATAQDDSGKLLCPVWPHPDYAAACTSGDWANYRPEAIEVHDFVEHWLSGLKQDGLWLAVFPTPHMQGVPVPPDQLRQAIEDELAGIE